MRGPFYSAGDRSTARGPTSTILPIELALAAALLLVVLGLGAYWDFRNREVDDGLWVLAGVLGAALGAVIEWPHGPESFLLWLLVSGFVLEHVLPWDVPLERVSESLPGIVEAGIYAAVGIVVVAVGVTQGLGPTGLPLTTAAVFLSVLIARALFEFGVLYGGADAKAIMVAGLILPLDSVPLLGLPSSAVSILRVYPFTLTLLMDAALFAAVIPIALAVRNLRQGSFDGARSFTGYRLPVAELPRRFVWLRDPTFHLDPETDVETTEQDIALRTKQAADLASKGVHEVWVTPQLPFIVFLWAGATAAVVAGNLLFDLFALL